MSDAKPPEEDNGAVDDVRVQIISAAARLIAEGGPDAATTRAVAQAAAVQAPTIYRLFGDKHGLLEAVTERAMAAYIADKSQRVPHPDPVQDLRDGWDTHVAFGLAHPGIFAIMSVDPEPRAPSPAVAAGMEILRAKVRRIARAGRLRVSEQRALALLQSMCVGTVLTQLRELPAQRDPGLVGAAREAVIAALTGEATSARGSTASAAASTLFALLGDTAVLTAGEQGLLVELLKRIADAGPQ